ncbi:MAG: antibiotic biosynthesis monooxygenase [Stellaceae bacterium]
MRFSNLVVVLAALCLATVRPVYAEETMNGPVYIVTYFDVAPTAAQQSAGIVRDFADASRKEDGNAGFEAFEEIGRPSRFATLEIWRDKKPADAHNAGTTAAAFRNKLQPLMIGGFGARPHGGLSVAAPKGQLPADALYVLTHVDVFPTYKDQAIELVKAQAEAARKDDGNLRYDVVQWDGHPNHFTLVEVWRDRKAFDTSVTTPHNKEFRDKLTPLEGALYDERLYQAVR